MKVSLLFTTFRKQLWKNWEFAFTACMIALLGTLWMRIDDPDPIAWRVGIMTCITIGTMVVGIMWWRCK